MRRRLLILLTLTLVACSVLGCDFQPSEVSAINQTIRLALGEMKRDGATRRAFAHATMTQRPYVLAVLPTAGITRANIASLDVPKEAKMWLASQLDDRSFDGPVLGILEADRAEWQALAEGVSAHGLLHTWKQPGEELMVELTMIDGSALITSLR